MGIPQPYGGSLTVRAEAQPCYCDEPNCIGYIGGKTQSEAQPKLSHAVKEGSPSSSDVPQVDLDSSWIR